MYINRIMSYLDTFTDKTGTDNKKELLVLNKQNILVIGATNFFELNFKLEPEMAAFNKASIIISQGLEQVVTDNISLKSIVKKEDYYQLRYILSVEDSSKFIYNYLQVYAQIQIENGDNIVYTKRFNLKVEPISGESTVIKKYAYYASSMDTTPPTAALKLSLEDQFKQNGADLDCPENGYVYMYTSFENGSVETYAIQWWTESEFTYCGVVDIEDEGETKTLYAYRVGPFIEGCTCKYRVVEK